MDMKKSGEEIPRASGSVLGTRRGAKNPAPGAVALVASGALCLGFTSVARAALEAELHEVNTSVGLKPTSSTNVWKLETDPTVTVITPAVESGPDLDDYIPSEGMLDNSFDPTKFTLELNPYTDNFDLGYTVQGLGAYQVISFEVQMSGGGYIGVEQDPSNPNNSIITDIGNVSGTETGIVDDIFFTLVPSLKSLALPADQDQLFFQLNLIPINPGPDFTPGVGTVFGGPDSFLTIIPANPDDTTDPPITTYNDPDEGQVIEAASSVPDPAGAAAVIVGTLGALAIARPHKRRV